jgi:TonB family protein
MRKRIAILAAALSLPIQAAPAAPAGAVRIVAPARARADPQSYIRAEDYPDWSLIMGEEGEVGVLLKIGASGRVTGCTIARSSGSKDLDSATCGLLTERARFTPAVDGNGNPAPSRVEQQVSWKRPPGAPPPFKPHGNGVIAYLMPEPVVAVAGPPMVREPVIAVPQEGPGEAELSVWDSGTDSIANLGKYDSIPECREAKARLELRPDQRAYCTLAPGNHPGLDLNWRPPR